VVPRYVGYCVGEDADGFTRVVELLLPPRSSTRDMTAPASLSSTLLVFVYSYISTERASGPQRSSANKLERWVAMKNNDMFGGHVSIDQSR
jgi:hypothetical protein